MITILNTPFGYFTYNIKTLYGLSQMGNYNDADGSD